MSTKGFPAGDRAGAPPAPSGNDRWLLAGAALVALATFLVFIRSRTNEFVELDDLGYIVDNRHIDTLDWQTVIWAFTRFHEANWHPLTMLSLALDRQLWGLAPFGFHLTNVLVHSCTAFCVCFLFASLLKTIFPAGITAVPGAPGRPLLVAGSCAGALFFGLHPLRVESVVWASERKDVLCIFFVTAALCWYLRFAAQRSARPGERFRSFRAYGMVLLMACLALLSKPAAVSLPLVLLVIDWYPLKRINDQGSFLRAVAEKVPLFLMAGVTALLTMLAQKEPISLSAAVSLPSRLLVACKALFFYVGKTIWPAGLAPLYVHPGDVVHSAPGAYLPYVLGVVAISIVVALLARRQRLWASLWLFYLATLAPTLGIIQVGGQWSADRYSYLPALGLALCWGGGGAWLVGRLRRKEHPGVALFIVGVAVCQLVSYTVLTLRLIPVWRTTETIASREIDLFPRQVGAAYYARAKYRNEKGDYTRALVDIDEALAIALKRVRRDKYSALAMTQAKILRNLGRLPEALAAVDWAIQTSVVEPPDEYRAFRDELAEQQVRTDVTPRAASGALPGKIPLRP